jgi:hypothetical protein
VANPEEGVELIHHSSSKNARIIWVCDKLHNFCIRMRQLDCDEFSARLHQIISNEVDPSSFGIIPVKDGGNRQNTFGYLPTVTTDDDFQVDADYISIDIFPSLFPDGTCQQNIVNKIVSCSLRQPK